MGGQKISKSNSLTHLKKFQSNTHFHRYCELWHICLLYKDKGSVLFSSEILVDLKV